MGFLEFVSESVYVDLQYDETSLTFTAGPVCLGGVSSPCGSPWSVCEVVVVPYVVRAVCCGNCNACTVVCVAFVLRVCGAVRV